MIKSNSRDRSFLSQATVHAVLQTQSSIPSFAIPLVKSNERTNTDYMPTTNMHGKIDGFVTVEPRGRLLPYHQDSNAIIGQDEIFALIDPDGKALVGTRQELIPQIEKWIHRVNDDLCRLNFALFCNNQEYAIDLGQTVFDRKHNELGDKEGAARWFVSAFVCLPLIRELTARFSKTRPAETQALEDLAPRFLFSSTRLIINFPDIVFANESISKVFLSKNFKRLIKFAQRSTGFEVTVEPDISERVVALKNKHLDGRQVKSN